MYAAIVHYPEHFSECSKIFAFALATMGRFNFHAEFVKATHG